MDLATAERIFHEYGVVLANRRQGEFLIPSSRLRRSKSEVVAACKLCMAGLFLRGAFSAEAESKLMFGIGSINHIAEDTRAARVNADCQRTDERGLAARKQLAALLVDGPVVDDVAEYSRELKRLDPRDELFWQRAYTLAGLGFSPDNVDPLALFRKVL